jgi:hypothetical protein
VWRACNLATFTSCLTGSVDYLFASLREGPGSKPGGYLCETGILLLALSRYIGDPNVMRSLASLPFSGCFTMLRADKCNPTWSHRTLFSQFHVRCRSSFRLHNRQSRLLGGSPVESLQSRYIYTMSHWSSGLPICFPSWGTRVQIPRGVLMWNRESPVSVVSLQ